MNVIRRERLMSASLLALAALWYGFWLTNGDFHFVKAGKGLGLCFNSMLEHLLRGEFDVDPLTVGDEGFRRDGRVFAYWGIFFALIRWPLTLIPGGLRIDVTTFSCFVAVCAAAFAKLQTLRAVFDISPASPARDILFGCLVLTILFGGAQVEFLRPSIYQEVCLWAGALAAMFNYFAVRGIINDRFSTSWLCSMSLLAGLALLARVSMGIGLYAALGLLLVSLASESHPKKEKSLAAISTLKDRILSARFLLPLLILLGFAVIGGYVNYQRWGDPTVFADFNLHLMNDEYPDRRPRTEAYGLFNLLRIPFGLIYYFFPIWVIHRQDGHLVLEEHQRRLIDATELPPSSFFLTDPLFVLLLLYTGWLLLKTRRGTGINWRSAVAVGSGLSVAWVLMLAAISMNFRYRIEFYPLFELGGFLGFFALCRSSLPAHAMPRLRVISIVLCAIGILASHLVMIMYKLSEFGPAIDKLRPGVITYYIERGCAQIEVILARLLL